MKTMDWIMGYELARPTQRDNQRVLVRGCTRWKNAPRPKAKLCLVAGTAETLAVGRGVSCKAASRNSARCGRSPISRSSRAALDRTTA